MRSKYGIFAFLVISRKTFYFNLQNCLDLTHNATVPLFLSQLASFPLFKTKQANTSAMCLLHARYLPYFVRITSLCSQFYWVHYTEKKTENLGILSSCFQQKTNKQTEGMQILT